MYFSEALISSKPKFRVAHVFEEFFDFIFSVFLVRNDFKSVDSLE